jgi:hypothetical protein
MTARFPKAFLTPSHLKDQSALSEVCIQISDTLNVMGLSEKMDTDIGQLAVAGQLGLGARHAARPSCAETTAA